MGQSLSAVIEVIEATSRLPNTGQLAFTDRDRLSPVDRESEKRTETRVSMGKNYRSCIWRESSAFTIKINEGRKEVGEIALIRGWSYSVGVFGIVVKIMVGLLYGRDRN